MLQIALKGEILAEIWVDVLQLYSAQVANRANRAVWFTCEVIEIDLVWN